MWTPGFRKHPGGEGPGGGPGGGCWTAVGSCATRPTLPGSEKWVSLGAAWPEDAYSPSFKGDVGSAFPFAPGLAIQSTSSLRRHPKMVWTGRRDCMGVRVVRLVPAAGTLTELPGRFPPGQVNWWYQCAQVGPYLAKPGVSTRTMSTGGSICARFHQDEVLSTGGS